MLRRLLKSAAFRMKMARFGIWYTRSRSLSLRSVRVAGKRIRLSFPPGEQEVLEYELGKILFQDCYGLGGITRKVATVLDIGANVGLFSLAARYWFPNARIHAYEPNALLEQYLKNHCDPLAVTCHLEAVGASSGFVTLERKHNSLHSVTNDQYQSEGIPKVAFMEAIQRIGGTVDVLKLDCEGAEWSLFADVASWRCIAHLTMEYHLWAKPRATVGELRNVLDRLGFELLQIVPSVDGSFGMLVAKNRRFEPTVPKFA